MTTHRQSQSGFPFPSQYNEPHAQPGQSHPGVGMGVWMNNNDPTGEFMYQMPPGHIIGQEAQSGFGQQPGAAAPEPGKDKGDGATEGSQPLE